VDLGWTRNEGKLDALPIFLDRYPESNTVEVGKHFFTDEKAHNPGLAEAPLRRTHLSFLAGIVCVLAAVGCSENPSGAKLFGEPRASVLPAPPTLDQGVLEILGLFPKGLETAATTRWGNVKQKYAAGLSDPAQMQVAKQMLYELSAWVSQKTPNMDNPPTGETKSGASSRAVLYMSMYVYGGPATTPPSYTASADNVVGLVTPGAPATIVTPTKHAGVQLEAGSVAENTIIVVTQNPTSYPKNCSGPLQTKLCQYPQFYTFDMFPHRRLLKAAKFNVCHVNVEGNRYPLANHDRFKLAHAKPANPADYTPGSIIRDGDGESVEILQMVPQTFSTCANSVYQPEPENIGALGILSHVARGLRDLISPKTAYAIDVGLGGLSFDMSPFNDLDPEGLPDFAVQSFTVGEGMVLAGGHVTVSYSVRNIGTATGASVPFAIRLVRDDGELGIFEEDIGTGSISSLVPGETASGTTSDATIPASVSPGVYSIRLVVGSNETFPDANIENNTSTSTVAVGEVWKVVESGNWNGVWTRRAASNVFDAVWTGPQGGLVTGVMTFTQDGSYVEFQRTESTDGNLCHYVGTLAPDGLSATGTETCPNSEGTFTWTASIGSQ
jgi:hypothetical protein